MSVSGPSGYFLGRVLHDAVACVVPHVHAEGKMRFGFHRTSPTRLARAPHYLYAMLLRPEHLSQKLDRPLPTKDGGILRTIGEACDYMTRMGKKRELRTHWQRACKLILAKEDVLTVSRALELALFMDAKLDVAKF
jgi:hypothetical protein